ncbi:MAG: glutamate--tRNA ligase [Candidatus Niyogibacteria bacterium]|nr:glutamate--tRNA ligase [Candidatus Niyogibacteria bacterium]
MLRDKKKIRTRIAPSPTGMFHIGTARTALFSWAYARQNGGEFILRIEDTDLERSEQRFEDDIVGGLKWLGLDWDNEGIIRQTERLDIYEKCLNKMLAEGTAFWCAHSPEELAKERDRQMQNKEALRHICEFRNGGGEAGNGIIRIKNDALEKIIWRDLIRDEVAFNPQTLGDFSLAKALRVPLYNFAVVVDDHDMEISHVIRGEDHIPNTPKQILIQRALGFEAPVYAHLPLILGKDRSKMSKRDGATAVSDYRKEGFLPEAMFNFISYLGWHPEGDHDILTREEFLKKFSLDRVQKGGAIFDLDKLLWINKEYIKKMPLEQVGESALEFLPEEWRTHAEHEPQFWRAIVGLERERLAKLSEIVGHVDHYFKTPAYDKEILRWKGKQEFSDIARHLGWLIEMLTPLADTKWSKEVLKAKIMPYAEENGRGDVLWPMRVSLCGKKNSPGPFELAAVLGRAETLLRIQKALEYAS